MEPRYNSARFCEVLGYFCNHGVAVLEKITNFPSIIF